MLGFKECENGMGGDIVIAEDRFARMCAEGDEINLIKSGNSAFAELLVCVVHPCNVLGRSAGWNRAIP